MSRRPGMLCVASRALCAVVAAGGAACVQAQAYPAKPVRFIVPWTPGSGTDLMARMLAQRLSEPLGQQVVVDNRGGAGGVLGTMITAQAAPDGYTIMLGTSAGMVVNPLLQSKLPYDAMKDFAPVSNVIILPQLLVANPQLPAKTMKDLVALAKAKPGWLSAGSSGVGTPNHLGTELLKSLANVNILHVPYKGGAQALTDVMGGQIHMAFSSVPAMIPHLKAGRLIALGVGSAKRTPALPNVPAIGEVVPGYEYSTWYGIFVPARTPQPIVARLNSEIVKALGAPEINQRFVANGGEPAPSSPDELRRYMIEESARWAKIIKLAGIRIE
jgi:tripartite-type tricarboxylate transporter receptor subunit TctC